MNLLAMFRRQRTAPVARERLQVLLAHERMASGHSELLNVLREEILAVIARHIQLDRDKVKVKLDRAGDVATLEIDVEMPEALARAAPRRSTAAASGPAWPTAGTMA
ncbi:MAG: cell division topological specificity factor MinE [Acetobacteraceae bacterium]|nr:cell division topological specificity factor MinE [Acetobacteraceae bacterium]